MLDDLFSNDIATSLTVGGTIGIIAASLILGLILSLVYLYTHKNESCSSSFAVTLIMLPVTVAIIILLIGNNVARAFSLVGAFSLIRFRSAPGDSKDIAYAFFALSVGLALGLGYIAYAVLFECILCGVMLVLWATKFGQKDNEGMRLRILLPEDREYQGAFDDILKKYTNSYKLTKVKTAEYGSLFEITYDVILKNGADTKSFIDSLRCKNGNLNIVLSANEKHEAASF